MRLSHAWVRKALQLGSVAFVVFAAAQGPWRNFKVAHNSRRLVGLMEGDIMGWLYGLNEDLLSLFGRSADVSKELVGSHAASSVFGLPVADPALALGHSLASWSTGMLLGALVPLVVAALLGKVFCSHLCPARLSFEVGQAVRRGLQKLGVELPTWTPKGRYGAFIFVGGVVASMTSAGAVWMLLLPHAAIGISIHLAVGASVTTSLWAYWAVWWLVDCLVSPGTFCRSVCPTGWLLEHAGRLSFLHLRKRQTSEGAAPCPSSCTQCIQACPYGWSPKADDDNVSTSVAPGCDHCSACVRACPQQKLEHRWEAPVLLRKPSSTSSRSSLPIVALLFAVLSSAATHAHHNKGLPHYGYFENYPQVPTQEYVYIQDGWEIGATVFNFQGMERKDALAPNDVKIFLYIYDLTNDRGYEGPVTFTLHHDQQVVTTFKRDKVDEENIYSTRETLPASGEYVLAAKVPGADRELLLPFEVDMDDGFSLWWLVALFAPLVAVFGLAYVGRTKKRKRRARPVVNTAMVSLLLAALASSSTWAAPEDAHDDDAKAVGHVAHAEGESADLDALREKALADIKNGASTCGSPEGMARMKAAGLGCGSGAAMAGAERKMGHMACAGDMKHVQTEDGMVMIMSGMPMWMFILAVVLVLVLSFVFTEWWPARRQKAAVDVDAARPPPVSDLVQLTSTREQREQELAALDALEAQLQAAEQKKRKNLLQNKSMFALVKSRWFSTLPQLLSFAALLFLVYAGLFGSRITNITPVAVWTIWWAALIFVVALVGPVFCAVCPWDAFANLVTRLGLSRRKQPLTLGLRFPDALRNVYPAIGLFTLLTWLELGNGMTTSPVGTALMGLGMAVCAAGCALVFGDDDDDDDGCADGKCDPQGKVFCRYLCPVGRISGIYANLSFIEIRAKKIAACKTCTTEDCKYGNDDGYPCPTGISLKRTQDATDCTQCLECVRSCPRHNVGVKLRGFGKDLADVALQSKQRIDLAWLALALLSLTLFHGLSMTPAWENFSPGGHSLLKWMHTTLPGGKTLHFTLAMALVCAAPMVMYALSCWLADVWARRAKGVRDDEVAFFPDVRELFIRYSWSLLPVALFYHLAHNLMHLLAEGGAIVPLLSDPLGRGSDWFGTAHMHVGSLLSDKAIWSLQVVLILVGHVVGIVVAHHIGHRRYRHKAAATRSLIPMLLMMILLSVGGLSLMAMDMNMRVGRM